MNNENPVGKWPYNEETPQGRYGEESSYEAAVEFLDGLGLVEDWGCGTAWAKRHFKRSKYVGVDGTKSPWCDEVDDLVTRTSSPDGILLRHVLEHNYKWRDLLANACVCAKSKITIVFFVPFSLVERDHIPSLFVPTLGLVRDDVIAVLNGWNITEKHIIDKERPEWIGDWIWFCEKK